MFVDLSNIFLIQRSLLFSTVACNATPARHLWYVTLPRNVSLGRLWSHLNLNPPLSFTLPKSLSCEIDYSLMIPLNYKEF